VYFRNLSKSFLTSARRSFRFP